jgi:integrase
MDITNDPAITDWFDAKWKALSTKENYLKAIRDYCEFTGKMPSELLDEAEEQFDKRLPMRKISVNRYVIDFRKLLNTRNLAPRTKELYMTGIKAFYRHYKIELPEIESEKAKPKPENVTKIPTKEDWQEVLKICDPLERAILLLGLSSGLSSIEIRNLKIKDFYDGYDEKTEITTLDFMSDGKCRSKTGVEFVTFLTPEASKAVLDYLAYRNKTSKLIDPRINAHNEKQKVITEEGYLFIPRLIDPKYLETKDENLRHLKKQSLIGIFRSISERSQKYSPKGSWNFIRAHNMRKHFNSKLNSKNCTFLAIEIFMGHALNATHQAYYRPSVDELREIYKTFIPDLTIQKELYVAESPEFLKIKAENEILMQETARHVVERSELQELRADVERSKNMLSAVWRAYNKEGVELEEEEDLLKDVDKY